MVIQAFLINENHTVNLFRIDFAKILLQVMDHKQIEAIEIKHIEYIVDKNSLLIGCSGSNFFEIDSSFKIKQLHILD